MSKQSAVMKIRIFWVRVHLSLFKLTFFLKILSGCTEYIAKSMLKKKLGPICWFKSLKIGQTVSDNKNLNFFFRGNLSTLKFTFWENVFRWTYRLLYDLYLKKKSGRYVDFKVQYWRERPGRQNGKFSLALALVAQCVKGLLPR